MAFPERVGCFFLVLGIFMLIKVKPAIVLRTEYSIIHSKLYSNQKKKNKIQHSNYPSLVTTLILIGVKNSQSYSDSGESPE